LWFPVGHEPKRKPADRDGPAAAPSCHPETVRLADKLLNIVGLTRDDRRARDAVPIVDSWLRNRWDLRVITMTVESITRQRKRAEGANWAPNSLKYFEGIIRKNCGG
jgi:hypothetical protein